MSAASKVPNPFFRSKKLDLGCYVNIKVIRDHTKRKAFAEFETQRYCSPYPALRETFSIVAQANSLKKVVN